MPMTPSFTWQGFSGEEYLYWIYPIGTYFKLKPCNYMFVKEVQPNVWFPCYIGQTEDLYQSFDDHKNEACAKRYGATHIHIHLSVGGEDVRIAEEMDLIKRWLPPCNGELP